MERVVSNLSAGRVRRESIHGREYLVAPVTMIVPGVLNGSQGALYYPPDEVAKDPQSWNGVPLVLGHPFAGGSPSSARDPEVANSQEMGRVYRSRITKNGRLVGEGWFDVEATRRVSPEVLRMLRAGERIEVSTGLQTDNEPAMNGASHGGRRYAHIARNYRPDHLAILLDQTGACSRVDGCGVNVNSKNGEHVVNAGDNCGIGPGGFGEGNTCAKGGGDGKEYRDTSGPIPMHNIKIPKSGKLSIDQAHDAMKQMGYRQVGSFAESTRIDPKTGAVVTKYEAPDGKIVELSHKQVKDAVMTGARNYQEAPREVASKHAARWAKNAANAQPHSKNTGRFKRPGSGTGRGELYETAQRGAIRLSDEERAKGATVLAELDAGHNPPSWVEDEAAWNRAKAAADKGDYDAETYWPVVVHIYQNIVGNQDVEEGRDESGSRLTSNQEGDEDMAKLTETGKKKIVDGLIANCDGCGWTEDDRETLNDLRDETLQKLHAKAQSAVAADAVVNAAKEGFNKLFGGKKELTVNEMPAALKAALEKKGGKEPDCVDGKDADGNPCGEAAKTENKAGTQRPLTENEITSAMSAEMREDLAFARAEKAKQKRALVEQLTANVTDPDERRRQAARLQNRSLDDLRADAVLLPKRREPEPGQAAPNYFGLGASVENAGEEEPDQSQVLPLPTINWTELAAARQK